MARERACMKAVPSLQGLNMWLQYLTLLGQANLPVPHSVQSIFNVASLVFASVTSLSLPLDCAIAKSKMNTALQRILVHLALPALVLLLLMCIQVIRCCLTAATHCLLAYAQVPEDDDVQSLLLHVQVPRCD